MPFYPYFIIILGFFLITGDNIGGYTGILQSFVKINIDFRVFFFFLLVIRLKNNPRDLKCSPNNNYLSSRTHCALTDFPNDPFT